MIEEIKARWQDTKESHRALNEEFAYRVNDTPTLKEHRDWVEQNIFGFGERSFHWLHKIIVDEMPETFSFLEIGVFRAQTLSLYQLLANEAGKKVTRYGITPLDGSDGHWDSDYKKDIETIHDQFGLAKDYTILHGLSTDTEIIKEAQKLSVDVLYVDGGHQYETVKNDMTHYPQIVKPGGYLIIDDCCNSLNISEGYFGGIEPVTRAVNEWESIQTDFEFCFSIVHIKVFKRK